MGNQTPGRRGPVRLAAKSGLTATAQGREGAELELPVNPLLRPIGPKRSDLEGRVEVSGKTR